MNVGAIGAVGMAGPSMNVGNVTSSTSTISGCNNPLANSQINGCHDKSNMMKLGVAMLLLGCKKDEDDCEHKKLAGALIAAAVLSQPEKCCAAYGKMTSIVTPVASAGMSMNMSA